jgi:uncharacterized protein (DUF58 family)
MNEAPENKKEGGREGRRRFLDPAVLDRVDKLELRARRIVEGFMAGLHRSPYHGFSVEFAQHREYAPGDDLRHLDWKILGRSGRPFIKQYEVETNFAAYILTDISESMAYGSRRAGHTKLEYASFLTAALSYLIIGQGDSVGLGLFHQGLETLIEPKGSLEQIWGICEALERAKPKEKTGVGAILSQFAERLKRRGIVILISDLFAKPEDFLAGLGKLHFARHEVLVFHLMDPDEIEFPFEGLIKFEGLEGLPGQFCHPRMIREHYLEALGKHTLALKTACDRHGVDYVRLDTSQPLAIALHGFLQSRALRKARR